MATSSGAYGNLLGWTQGTSASDYNTYTTDNTATHAYLNAIQAQMYQEPILARQARQQATKFAPVAIAPKPLSFYDKLRKEIDEWIKL